MDWNSYKGIILLHKRTTGIYKFIYLFVTITGANLTIFPKENEAKQTPQPQDNEKE